MAMRKSKILVLLVLLVSFISLAWRSSKAADAGDASSALCEYGIALYNDGQVEDAIHELKKALIINPYNLKAKNYLRKIYSERNLPVEPLWEPKKKIKISEYENQIKKLQEEARYYQKQLSALNKQNQAKEAELERLNRQLQSQKELFSRKEQDLLSAHKNRKDIIAGLEGQLSQLQKEASDYQKQFTVMNDLYTAKQAELERLTRQLEGHKDRGEKISVLQDQVSRLQKETDDYQKQLYSLNSQYISKETELERIVQQLHSQKELLDKKEKELIAVQGEQKSKTQELEKQINKFKKDSLAYQNRLDSLRKKHLAELTGKKKELTKLKADYESRLKKMTAALKAKDAPESILIEECQAPWMQGGWRLDDFKEDLAKLECEFDKDFISTEASKLAEKQGVSSWEKLNRELQVLMPSLESAFSEEDFLYASGKDHEFEQLETQASKDADMESMLSDSDN
jgi:myosin heavy subunit